MALRRPHKVDEKGGVLWQAIRLAACVYVPRAEAPGLPSPQTPDFSPGAFGCLAHRPIFIAIGRAFPKLAHTRRTCPSTHLDSRLRGNDGMRVSGQWKGSEQLAMPVATDTMEDENGGGLGGSEDAGGDARSPSLGPRLRGDDGWWAGMTILVYEATQGAIFRGMTWDTRYVRNNVG